MRQIFKLKNLTPPQNKVHIIGIGGIGTSALARWFLAHKHKISGSDANPSEITSELRKNGIRVFIGHKAKNLPKNANLAIFSVAVPSNNPELIKALKLGIPVKTYAEMLGELIKQYPKAIAVAGAHGKSTATALLSLVLTKAGFDPTVIIGTKLKEFGNSNFKNGKGDYLILEADEYHRSFLSYSPFAAIITNIDREHLDYYKNFRAVKNAFLKFIKNIQPKGILVVNEDDKNLFGLREKIQKIVQKKNIKVIWYSITNSHDRENLLQKLEKALKISGKHNISNALGVYALAKVLGIKEKNIFSAIGSYRGAWRRMEYRGKFQTPAFAKASAGKQNSKFKVNVYDDYAHHPTEIKATLEGLRQKYPKTKIICVFQPHLAQRLKYAFKEFTKCFDAADVLILLDIYKVPGRHQSPSSKYNAQKLASRIERRLTLTLHGQTRKLKLNKVIYLANNKNLPKVLAKIIQQENMFPRNSAYVVMMGAGDIYKLTSKLVSL